MEAASFAKGTLVGPPQHDGSMPTVFLTGATGFIGGHVARALLDGGYRVRALVRDPNADVAGCEPVVGDLERAGEFARALAGCRYVVHCAALYSFAPRDRARMWRVNVAGTAALLEAARIAGVERAVVTSSASTVGPSHDGMPVDERGLAEPHDAPSSYHASKREQERAALAARVPVVLLLPTAPVGPGDAAPTPTGALVRDFLRGKIFALPPRGGMNLVPVEDVARAHVAALTRGRASERYLLGGEDFSLHAVWQMLAEVTGRPLPRLRVPLPAVMAMAYADEARCRALPRARPFVPVEGARMARHLMYVDAAKARAELGFAPGPVRDALRRAVAWYRSRDAAA
jgi:dihydroflavonol-4-reductase